MKNLFKLSCSEVEVHYFNRKEKILLDMIDAYILSYKDACLSSEKSADFLYYQRQQIDGLLLSLFFMNMTKYPLHVRLSYLVKDNLNSIIYYNNQKKD